MQDGKCVRAITKIAESVVNVKVVAWATGSGKVACVVGHNLVTR